MNPEDLAPFREPYVADVDENAFARAAGVHLSDVSALQQAIGRDRNTALGGIGWWHPHLGAKQRILISDHLLQAVGSVGRNLVEARLHELEGRGASAKESEFNASALSIVNEEVVSELPRRASGLDELHSYLRDLHWAGFFRSVGSALDCLGHAIVGVSGFPVNILRSDLRQARQVGRKKIGQHPIAEELTELLDDAEAAAGPEGWLDWATDYRNMLVHRPRRLILSTFERRQPELLGANSRPILRVDAPQLLARDPARSDIEAFLATAWAPAMLNGRPQSPTLEERATTTIAGVRKSVLLFVEDVSHYLTEVWERRRQNPAWIRQPPSQWPVVPSSEPQAFAGYSPGELRVGWDTMIANPALHERFETSMATDDFARAWDEMD